MEQISASEEPSSPIVLQYCNIVRGVLNNDQGGPLHPPGLRMAETLTEVRASLGKNLALNKSSSDHKNLQRLADLIDAGLELVKSDLAEVQEESKAIKAVAQTLDPASLAPHSAQRIIASENARGQ